MFVRRPPAPLPDTPQSFEAFAPGAEVLRVAASLDATNHVTVGAETSLSALCGSAAGDAPTCAAPRVSWDGSKIAFSARKSATEPVSGVRRRRRQVRARAHDRRRPATDDGDAFTDNGELVHNFDPAFAPDGRLVFASTRGNTKNGAPSAITARNARRPIPRA